jgi:AraC family transcriptional regulator
VHSGNRHAAVLIGAFGRATVSWGTRRVVAHAHAEFNFLFKVAGGDACFHAGNQPLPLDDEHIIVLDPWETHAKDENADAPTLILSLLVEPSWLEQHVPGLQAAGGSLFPHHSVRTTAAVRALAERLVRSVQACGPLAEDGRHTELLRQLVTEVSRAHAEMGTGAPRRLVDARIRRAIGYIQEHAADNPDLQRVASHVGLSRSQFYARFKDALGVTPQQFLDWARMRIAIQLLAGSDLPMSEVAARVGFFATSHFTRFFVHHVAMPPTEFRRCLVA